MIKNRQFSSLVLAIVSLVIVSCQKKEGGTDAPEGPAQIMVKAGPSAYDDEIPLDVEAKAAFSASDNASNIITRTTALNDDFMIVSELMPIKPNARERAALEKTAATESEDLLPLTKYALLIFDESGSYVNGKHYTHTQEGSTAAMTLDGGKRYTFVAYSINSKTENPNITWTDPSNKILANATIVANGTADIMYFKKEIIVRGNELNVIDIKFKHMFTKVTTTIDASATGYPVATVSAGISRHMPTGTMMLDDAEINRSGAMTLSTVTFGTLNTGVVTSQPTMINAMDNTSELRISTLKIGPLTKNNVVVPGLDLAPGVKYKLNLRVVPSDELLTHAGFPAARIAGDIWARHNLGANTALDPDALPITSGLHGNYYQWGRSTSVGNGTSVTISNHDPSNNPSNTSWNIGTEAIPLKGSADPCPTGYRVPTKTEMQRLVDATTSRTVGSRSVSNTNFTGASVLTSKKNANVKLTLPAQGTFRALGTRAPFTFTMEKRGAHIRYFNSTVKNMHGTSFLEGNEDGAVRVLTYDTDSHINKVDGRNLRCVGYN